MATFVRLAARRGLATVRPTMRRGIRQAVSYLVELGHNEIYHVDGGTDPGSPERRQAHRVAMRRHGLSDHAGVIPGAQRGAAGGTMLECDAEIRLTTRNRRNSRAGT
jgi:DNA-binding LacI/PurR family transcriptional regulator